MKAGGKFLLFFVILLAFLIQSPAYAMKPAWNITNNREYISDLAIAADGSRLITGTLTGIATVYDQNGTIIWKTQVPGSLLVGCKENGSAFIVGSQENIYSNKGSVRSYDRNGSKVWSVNTGAVSALGIAGKNNHTVVGNRMGDLIVLDGQGEVVGKYNDFPQTNVVSDISVSDNGNMFVYALYEMYPLVRIVYIDSQKKGSYKGFYNGTKTGYGGSDKIKALAISSDGKYTLTAYGEGSNGILCMYGNKSTMLWSKDIDGITEIAILANGSSAYAGTRTGEILGYSLSGNLTFNYSSGSEITSLSLAADKNLLAAGNAQGNLYIFNDTGRLIWTTLIEDFPLADISQIEISRDGRALAVLVNHKNLYYFVGEPGTLLDESSGPSKFTGLYAPVSESSPRESNLPVLLIIFSLFATLLVRRE